MLHKNSKVGTAAQFGLIAVCVIFFVFLAFAGEAKAATYQCDSCGDCRNKINSAGNGDTVELNKDIWNTTDLETAGSDRACAIFNNKQNITFDCRDYVIDGTGYNYGVYFSDGSNGNTIKNCYITGFSNGIYVNYADSLTFNEVEINYNSSYGIYFYGVNTTSNSISNTLSNVTANNNNTGIFFQYSSSNTLSNVAANNNNGNGIDFSGAATGNNLNNVAANNNSGRGIYLSSFASGFLTSCTAAGNQYEGVYLWSSNSNTLSGLTITNNKYTSGISNDYGISFNNSGNNTIINSVIKWNNDGDGDDRDIYISSGSDNVFYNNNLISKSKIKDAGVNTHWNKWDSIGGDQKPGNSWEVFDYDSEGCFDIAPADGYCDSKYLDIPDKLYDDNYPKHINSISAFYCNGCTDCNNKIASSSAGSTVYLSVNINNTAGNCINLKDKQNLTFDCQGYTIDSNGAGGNGVYLDNGGANGLNTVKNCVITDFSIGVYALNSNQNTIIGDTVKANTVDVKLTAALNNVFYNNKFLNQGKITDEEANATAWDNGAVGNHWEGYDSPSEGCVDAAPPAGVCDAGYTISSSGAKDNFAKYVAYDPYSCATCEDCSAKIAVASSGDTIKLTESIVNYSVGTCVKFSNKQGITFDCQGYGIDGTGAANSYGVYILGAGGNDNNTVKNCYVTAFTNGVYANNSNGNNFDNIAANYNTNYGFYFSQSSSNIFKNNITANNNTAGYGLYFVNSNSNILTDPAIAITANNNNRGIFFSNSGSNELINLTANNNTGYGVYFSNSHSNTLSNIAVNNNTTAGIHFSISGNNTIKDSTGIKFNPVNINIASDNGVNGNKFYNNDFVSKNKITDGSALTQWDDGAGQGNWWQSYDSGDEGCVDGGGLICNTAYTVGSLGTKDDFPKWKKLNDDEYHCADCASCTGAIANAMYGDKIILDNHIFGAAGDCVNFESYKEGLTFKSGCSTGDCIIQGPGNYYGIRLDGYNESNTIKNIIISNFNSGIGLFDKGNKFNVFSDIMSSYNQYGIQAYKWQVNTSESNIFTYIVANNNSARGIYLNYGLNNVLTYSNLFNNGVYGLELYGGTGSNTVASSTLKLNATDVNIYSSINNVFYNNQFTSNTKISDSATNATVWDNGIKGNWWEAYDADEDGCFDSGANPDPNFITPSNPVAGDSLCDNRYEVKTGIYDRYPQYKGGVGAVYTCSTCAECNSKIIQAKYGDKVQLTQDIFGVVSTCIELNYKQGITFDCQNHLISGQNSGYGIQIKGNLQNDYNTIKNCVVSKFQYGVYIYQSSANTMDNITTDSNSYYGVYSKNSNFNTLTNITAKNHTSYSGIYFDGSDNNQLSQITVNNNTIGIYFLNGSDNNTVTASVGIKSNKTNVAIDTWSYSNIFYNNQFISKTKISDDNTGVGNNITHWNKWDSAPGDQKPGNQWEDYDTVSEGCSDDGFGYCVAKPYWKDKFPKYYGVTTDRSCNTCETCNTEIANALYGEKVTLTEDIAGVNGTCATLNYKEGITFDCGNFKIVGVNGNDYYQRGIYVNGFGAEYNTIKNCNISQFVYGVYLNQSSNNNIKNTVVNYNDCAVNYCDGAGVYLYNNSNSNNLDGITASYNESGIYFYSSNSNNLTNINLSNNSINGLYFSNSDSNIASSSNIKLNTIDVNIDYSSSDNNKFYNNELVSKDKIVDNGTGTKWDNGATDGGNHWELFDTADECYYDGAVQICCTGAGAYCGNVYKIDNDNGASDGGVSVDNYPKTGAVAQIYTCETCADCSAKIASSTAGDTVKLTKDIIGYGGTCIDFGGKSAVTFNCQDYIINGNNSASSYGVYITSDYNTVKNCNISNFYYGVYFYNVKFSILKYSAISSCQMGVSLYNSYNNSVSEVGVSNNTQYGIQFGFSKYNVLTNVIANNNRYGVSATYRAGDNTLINITALNNSDYGIAVNGEYSYGDMKNTVIASSVIKWNGIKDITIDQYACNTILYDNKFISKNNIIDNGGEYSWTCGGQLTIWDKDGVGNHWDGYDSDDEGCKDVAPINGICDSAYVIDANSKDNYPKYIGGISTFYCNSCADCNNKIASSSNGSTIYLANNISDFNAAGNCLNFSDKKQNLIFNCQGYSLTGNGATGNGVYLNNTASAGIGANTIKNCVIKSFNKGVYIADSDNNIIASSTINANITKDIEIIDIASAGNIFYANEFLNESKMADGGTNTHWNNWTGANSAPGNHWQGYDEPVEACNDTTPVDGYCDTAYTITSSSAVDNYPKYVGAVSQYECNSCSDCNTKIAAAVSGDTIKLTKNIVNHSGDCVKFQGRTGITFDCQNYAIDGDNISNGSKGVYLKNSNSNNKIKNCRISGFNYGVYLENSDSNYLEVLDASNNKVGVNGYGVYLTSSGGGQDSQLNNLTNITANNNYSYGIYFQGGDTKWNDLINIIANYNGNSADSNSSGIYFAGAQENDLTNITADYNIVNGINLTGGNNTATSSEIKWNKVNIKNTGSNNTFYNNKLISKEKIDDTGTGTLWDNGINLGNWWEAFDGDNENCFNDGSDICTNDYEAESGRFDGFPQYKGVDFNKQDKTCSSCSDCSEKIKSAYYGEKVLLTQDINTANADCVDFGQYKEGVTLDCQTLYYISGTSGSSYKGVYIYGYGTENNSVKNCAILGFDYGIYVWYSDAVNLTNMEIYNSGEGIYIYSNAGNNILDDIKANYNRYTGVRIEGSNNTFKEISANNNERGLLLSGKGSNTLSSANEFKNNSQSGIQVWCSAGSSAFNTITDSVVKQNKENINIAVGCTLASGVANIFYDNEFISKEKIDDRGETTEWDNGAVGNWWEAFDWEDESCYDDASQGGTNSIAGDSLCDNRYEVETGVYDNYPKYKGLPYNQTYTCNSCADCSSKIQSARYGETVNLAQDIYTETDCVNFGNYKEGVTFDCDKGAGERYSIAGKGGYTGVYIKGEGVENHTVKNCQLRNFGTGIKLDGSDGNTIENVAANNPGAYSSGVYLNYSDNNKLKNINADYNYNGGIYFTYSNNNNLDNISAQYGYNTSSCSNWMWGYGLYFQSNSSNNTVTNSVIKYHYRNIYIYNNTSQNNKFYNNHFISKEKMEDNGTGTKWDDGISAGNWWEACGDADSNGICDAIPYWKDNFPKHEGGEGTVTTCTTCADCNEKIIQAKYGETVRLTKDIFLHSGTCIKFNYKEGVIFDGGGCLTGDCIIGGTAGGDGINVCGGGMENNKIENFDLITNFTNGIYINQSAANILENIAANNNNNAGIYLTSSNLNNLLNISANNNYGYPGTGIYFSNSSSNFLIDINANNNKGGGYYGVGCGILFQNSNTNILTNIITNNNINKITGGGVCFSGSNSNVLNNITANNNSLEKDSWYGIDKGGGVYFSSSNSNILTNIIAENNTMDSAGSGGGLSFNSSSNNKISFATSTSNYKDGIYFSNSGSNTIASSTISGNNNKDINISSGSGNMFFANEFNSKSNMADNGASTRWNYWTGSANAKPGNHWDAYDTAGECCFDSGANPDSCGGTPVSFWPYDGYCDNRYEIKTGVYDNYPIRKSVKPADFSITAAYAGSLTSNSTCENIIFWENNGDVDEYGIYRSTDGIIYNKIDTVDYSKNNYIDSAVDYLNYYGYYIEARNGVFTTIADCNYGGGLRPYCEEDNGTETAALYPTICLADLTVSGVCSAVDLSWADVTPTGSYYGLRSDDGGAVYNNIYSVSDDNSSDPWTYQDTDASTSIDFYYKIQNCIGACPSSIECQPDAAGPRDDCYAESNIGTINPCQTFLMPTWKEVKP
ncbi:MAG: NosD domain-containing protein [bacterium]|nr:NosD domain-containing protein [bacterium]